MSPTLIEIEFEQQVAALIAEVTAQYAVAAKIDRLSGPCANILAHKLGL